jgi:hypothetical protein
MILDQFSMSFLDCISEEGKIWPLFNTELMFLDRELALQKFKSAVEEGMDISFDLRLKKKFVPPSNLDPNGIMEEQNICVLALAYPQIENDKIVGIMGCKCSWGFFTCRVRLGIFG